MPALGHLRAGRPQDAKASADVASRPDAIAAGTKLIAGARAYEIPTEAAARATGANRVGREGRAAPVPVT